MPASADENRQEWLFNYIPVSLLRLIQVNIH
jgi:hypothetical protein